MVWFFSGARGAEMMSVVLVEEGAGRWWVAVMCEVVMTKENRRTGENGVTYFVDGRSDENVVLTHR